MATQAIQDILDTGIPRPSLTITPTGATPAPEFGGVARGSKGYTISPGGEYRLIDAGEPRTFSGSQGLLIEKGSQNKLGFPRFDPGGSGWNTRSGMTLSQVGTAMGQPQVILREADADQAHRLIRFDSINTNGDPFTVSTIVQGARRDAMAVRFQLEDSNGNSGNFRFDASLSNEEITRESAGNGGSIIHSGCIPLRQGFKKVFATVNPDSGFLIDWVAIHPQKDGLLGYYGDSSKGLNLIACFVEPGETSTTLPIENSSPRDEEFGTSSYSSTPDWWSTSGTFIIDATVRSKYPSTCILQVGNERLTTSGLNQIRLYNNDRSDFSKYVSGSKTIPYQRRTFAFSFNSDEILLSYDGGTSTNTAEDELANELVGGGNLGLGVGIGGIQKESCVYHSIRFIPKTLPESTLNILTA